MWGALDAPKQQEEYGMTKRLMVTVAVLSMGLASLVNAAEAVAKKEAPAVAQPVANATLDNLQAAYNNESNAKARYEAFAAKADAEGYKSVASLFRGFAKSDAMRAERHAGMIEKLGTKATATIATVEAKTTKENLEATVLALTAEKDTMYPAFAAQAVTDKNEHAAMGFKGSVAIATENIKSCKKVLGELDAWKAAGKVVLVCQVCTYVSIDPQLVKCPVCAAPREKFDVIK
jgi:rubrerythrin